jgi:general secretion pathway protein G
MTQNNNLMNLYTLLHPKPVDSLGVRQKDVATNKGFTLVELIMVIALIGILATMSVPLYNKYKENAKTAAAIADIGVLSNEVSAFILDRNNSKPSNLGEIGRANVLDPWKNPYEYRATGVLTNEYGVVLLNENSFDLFSKGKDGDYSVDGSNPLSKDDVARMNDGTFVGKRVGLLP